MQRQYQHGASGARHGAVPRGEAAAAPPMAPLMAPPPPQQRPTRSGATSREPGPGPAIPAPGRPNDDGDAAALGDASS